MQSFERYLVRWRGAGLIDEATESAIRAYESAEVQPSGRRWQVILALVLGGILLGAGVLLFVAANWDEVSPGWRLTLVLGVLALLHGAGILAKERFAGFATTMHALGTVAAGAAIALVGQIFNMQEHWPAAVMLWALCAVAGWWLLGDQFQQTLTLLLVPAWLISEWMVSGECLSGFRGLSCADDCGAGCGLSDGVSALTKASGVWDSVRCFGGCFVRERSDAGRWLAVLRIWLWTT